MKFKDPIKPKERKESKEPWDFKKPTYDQARAGNIYAGDTYGSGFTNPIGTEKSSGISASPVPQNTFRYPAHECIDEEV
jgi:hypothetical protein